MPTLPTNRKSLSALAQRASLIFAGRNLAEESGAGQADAACAASRSESVSGDSSPASRGPRGGSAARSAFQTSENPQQIGAFVASRPAPSGFFPILPADVSAVASSGEVFRSLGSRTDPVLHVRFPAPWSVVAENRRNLKMAVSLEPRANRRTWVRVKQIAVNGFNAGTSRRCRAARKNTRPGSRPSPVRAVACPTQGATTRLATDSAPGWTPGLARTALGRAG